MLFLTLVIYIAAWIPLKALVHSISFLTNLKLPIVHGSMFLLAFLLAFLLTFFVHSYQPEAGLWLTQVVKTRGFRWMILMTALGGALFFSMSLFDSSELKYLFLPVAAVSAVNWLGLELWPRWFMTEDEPALTVAPRLPMPEVKQEIHKDFEWQDQGQEFRVDLIVRHALYEKLKGETPPEALESWPKLLVSQGLTGEIRELGLKLAKLGKPFGSAEEIHLVLGFIQNNIKYLAEKSGLPKYPIVTLVDQEGDSRDIAILSAAILRCMGYDVALIQLAGHYAVGIRRVEDVPAILLSGGRIPYSYCEITASGWKVGSIPEGLKESAARVYAV